MCHSRPVALAAVGAKVIAKKAVQVLATGLAAAGFEAAISNQNSETQVVPASPYYPPPPPIPQNENGETKTVVIVLSSVGTCLFMFVFIVIILLVCKIVAVEKASGQTQES